MTTIRATCPNCGGVDFFPADVHLSPDATSYSFICPICAQPVTKPADRRTAGLLICAGAIEAEVREHTVPPLTFDDLLDFMNGDLSMRELVA